MRVVHVVHVVHTALVTLQLIHCRPGFVRLNLTYFMSDDEVDYVINAVKIVALDGWKLLPR